MKKSKGNMYGKESKKCKYCGATFYKNDFPKVFHRMVTCGSAGCRKKHTKEWTLKSVCVDCGKRITNNAKRCNVCSSLGENNSFFGKTHRPESLAKIKIFKKGHVPYIKGKHHTEQAKLKNAIAHTGVNSSCWKGGLSFEPYSPEFNSILKNQIRIRDREVCQICGEPKQGRSLDIHHIDYNKKNNVPLNLITLCRKCHGLTNFNRNFWCHYFTRGFMELTPHSDSRLIEALEYLDFYQINI